jgi:cold shock CspA family protein
MAPENVKWFVPHNRAIDRGDYRSLAEGARGSYNAEAGEGGPKAANVQLT